MKAFVETQALLLWIVLRNRQISLRCVWEMYRSQSRRNGKYRSRFYRKYQSDQMEVDVLRR